MRYPRLLFSILLLTAIAAGCKKSDDPVYHGMIRNNLNNKVHLDFYGTLEDYGNNANIIQSVVIEPHGQWQVPNSFESGDNLYLDWYTDDYYYSNWGMNPKFNVAEITPAMDPVMSINEGLGSYARLLCLDNNKTSTTWDAYDAYWSGSVWSSLPENDKYRQLVFRKDLTGAYYYKNDLGEIKTMNFSYAVPSFSTPYVYLQFDASSGGNSYSISPYNNSWDYSYDTVSTQSNFPETNFYQYYFKKRH